MSDQSDQAAWLERVCSVAGLTLTDLARRAGLRLDTLHGVRDGEIVLESREIADITSVVLDGYDAEAAQLDELVSPTPTEHWRTQREWMAWYRSGLRRRPLGLRHLSIQELAHRSGLDADLLLSVERGEAELEQEALEEVARAMRVPVPTFPSSES